MKTPTEKFRLVTGTVSIYAPTSWTDEDGQAWFKELSNEVDGSLGDFVRTINLQYSERGIEAKYDLD